jgi:ribosome-binding protein aMBF1 (putative translation factor)
MSDEEEDDHGCAMCGEEVEGNGHIVPEEGPHPATHWRDFVAEAMCTDSGARVCKYCWEYGEEVAKRWFREGVPGF